MFGDEEGRQEETIDGRRGPIVDDCNSNPSSDLRTISNSCRSLVTPPLQSSYLRHHLHSSLITLLLFTLLFLFPSSFFSFHPPSSLFTLLLFSPRSSPFTLLSPFSSSFFSFHPPSPLLLLHLLFPYSVFLILLFSTSFFFHPHSFL